MPNLAFASNNPYIAGRSVHGTEFWGREDILTKIKDTILLSQQNAIVLYGQRRIGKTSILLQLQGEVLKEQFYSVYFDLMGKGSWPLSQLLRAMGTEIVKPFKFKLSTVEFDFEKHVLQRVQKELGEKRLVLLLDEFDVLDYMDEFNRPKDTAANEFLGYLRNLIEHYPNIVFVIAMGRKMEDLSAPTLSVFKSAFKQPVSVMSETDTWQLILLAETKGSLHFEPDAVSRIYQVTNGHPYLVQLLCERLFVNAWANSGGDTPIISLANVDAEIEKTAEGGDQVFEWIWRGLAPAERIVLSSLAVLLPEETSITSRTALQSLLEEKKLRITGSEIRLAPGNLVDWQLLREVDGGFQFFIELLRRWTRDNKPIDKVSIEITLVSPWAEAEYQSGLLALRNGNANAAIDRFQQVLQLNEAHIQARLALAQAYRSIGNLNAALNQYELAYLSNPDMARDGFLLCFLDHLRLKEQDGDLDAVITDADRILDIEKTNQEALDIRKRALIKLAEACVKAGDFNKAEEYYEKAGLKNEKQSDIERAKFQRELKLQVENLQRRMFAWILIIGILGLLIGLAIGQNWIARAADMFQAIQYFVTGTPTSTLTFTPSNTPTSLPTSTPRPTSTLTLTRSPTPRPSQAIVAQLLEGNSIISYLTFSDDGSLLAVGLTNGQIKLLDINTLRTLREFYARSSIKTMEFTPENKYLVSASNDGILQFWDIQSGQEDATRSLKIDNITEISISKAKRMSVASLGAGVKLYDIGESENKAISVPCELPDVDVYAVDISNDGQKLLIGSDDAYSREVYVCLLQNPSESFILDAINVVTEIKFAPDEKSFYFDNGSVIGIYDFVTKSSQKSFSWGVTDNINGILIASPGNILVAYTFDMTQIWDQEHKVKIFQADLNAWDIALSPDEKLLAVAEDNGNALKIINLDGYGIATVTPSPTKSLTPTITLTPTQTKEPTLPPTPTLLPPTPLPTLPPTFTPKP